MMTRRGRIALIALGGAVAAMIVVELALGAIGFGTAGLADPCTSKPAFHGGGLDGAVQRFALSGLSGAACELHTTREELVLSFVPSAQVKTVRWDRPTIERALRAGFDRAAEHLAGDGAVGGLLKLAVERLVVPSLAWFLDEAT